MTNPPHKGICCPKHPTARLRVEKIRRVACGVVRRYRVCTVDDCPYRVTTEERIKPASGCRKKNYSPNT